MSSTKDNTAVNTDVEIWRKPGARLGMEYYQPSIHVTAQNDIGIDVGGHVYVMPIEEWHKLAAQGEAPTPQATKPVDEQIDRILDNYARDIGYDAVGKIKALILEAELRAVRADRKANAEFWKSNINKMFDKEIAVYDQLNQNNTTLNGVTK